MPTYQIKAPDGKTYRIAGPAGASDEDVRAEVLRQNPSAGKTDAQYYTAQAGRAAWNLPMSGAEALKGMMMSPVELAKLAFTDEGHKAAKGMYDKAASVLTGGVQAVRELSPQQYRGSAPAMDKTEFNSTVGEYNSGRKIASKVADDPAGYAIAAASILDPALRAARVPKIGVSPRGISIKPGAPLAPNGIVGLADDAVMAAGGVAGRGLRATARAAGAPARVVNQVTHAERRGKALAGEMSDEATGIFKGNEDAALATAAAQDAISTNAASSATRGRRFAETLTERAAAEKKAAAAPELDFAGPKPLSQLGDDATAPALAKKSEIEAEMKAAYDEHMANTKAIGEARANAGESPIDGEYAKKFLQEVKDRISPDPIQRKPVSSILDPKAGGAAHRRILDVLKPTRHDIGADEVIRAQQQGHKVFTDAVSGQKYIRLKPGIEALEDLRREIGDAAHGKGDAHGFGAVSQTSARYLYKKLNDVMDEYSLGAHPAARDAWRKGKEKLEAFEKVKAGQNLVGMQNGTDVAAVPAANIPGRVLAGGRDTMRQAAAVAGDAPVAAIARNEVQTAFAGKTADQVEAALRGTKLGDIVAADPDLAERVASYAQRLKASEAAASKVTLLEKRAQLALKRSDKLAARSGTAAERAAKAKEVASGYRQSIDALEVADPRDVGKQYTAILDDLRSKNLIDKDKYQAGLKLAARAEKDFHIKDARKRWIRYAGYAAGTGVIGGLVADVVSVLRE